MFDLLAKALISSVGDSLDKVARSFRQRSSASDEAARSSRQRSGSSKSRNQKTSSLVSPDFHSKRAAVEEKFRAYQEGMALRQKQTGKKE